MKKLFIITTFIIVLLVCFLGVTYSYEYNENDSLKFNLIGPSTLYVDVNTDYEEYGIEVIYNGMNISSSVNIDSSSVDTSILGEYKVKYELNIDENKEYVYRIVKVIDMSGPSIKLNGDDIVYVMLGGSYVEEGYEVTDNYDGDIKDRVNVTSNLNISKEGEYKIEYRVTDSSGNESVAVRTVIVKAPEVTLADISGNKYNYTSNDATKYKNTITKNMWTATGIYYEGYVKNTSNVYRIKLKNKDNSLEYLFNMSLSKNNYYKGNVDLTLVPNGEYVVYVIGNNDEKLLNKLDGLSRLVRAKIGDKLVDISYSNDEVNLTINDFNYEYDILIDVGHGDTDTGASNGIILEKDMNLKQSLYEKCRYESMGYKVYITRNDDSYGYMLGSNNLNRLQRRALVMGYYGAVSRVTYSNHHNASYNSGANGFEILVSNKLSLEDLVLETSLYNKYKKYYNINDNGIRLYSRDYDSGGIYNKLYGKVYSYMDYYAVIRIPSELFNVKSVIYEPIYMSNFNDFSWYWTKKHWIDVTEIKIEEYVNYLGGTYNEDNSMCL